jgi:hypothetical protein
MTSKRLQKRIDRLTRKRDAQSVGMTAPQPEMDQRALMMVEEAKRAATAPRLVDGSPLPEGMVPGIKKTMEFRDVNQNGIEDRSEGIYMQRDLVPASSLPTMTPAQRAYQDRFFVGPDDGFRNMDPGFGMSLKNMSPEEEQTVRELLQRAQQVETAPLGQIAQELAMQGEGDDTQLAHLRAGEVVLPPEFFEDDKFESAVEKKFNELGIDPEQAVVGTGVASLNLMTGLEQFGFFKKLGKKLKKVVKKVAPIALPALGIAGFAGAGPLAGIFGKGAAGAAAKAATGAAKTGIFGGTLGPSIRAGIGGFFNPATGTKGIFGGQLGPNIRRGIGGLFGGQQQVGGTGDIIGTLDGKPITQADYANLTTEQIMQIQPFAPSAQQTGIFGGTLGPRLRETFLGSSDQQGVLGNIFGGGQQQGGGGLFGGGFGDALKMGGIGALAAGLGKLAYEDAQKQKGVPLTPLTTMSPTGRYNIEAEIAKRMGQPEPNPVEFGLLPAGTIPELSGGKPRGMSAGGIMAFAQGGAVQMQKGGEMDPSMFPRMDGDINGPGTETSDDIPAMLSDGEFVMTGRAVRGAGSYEMQADPNGIISLMPTLEEDRERGMNLMYKMMDTFAGKAKAS